MTESSNLNDLFVPELQNVVNACKQWSTALSKFETMATGESLRLTLKALSETTDHHLSLLTTLLVSLRADKHGDRCVAMAGIVNEAEALLRDHDRSDVRDSALILSAQKSLHYQVSVYGTLRAWADQLGHEDAARAFDKVLHDVRAADERLTDIADSINPYGHVGPGRILQSPARSVWNAGRVGGVAQGARR